MTSIAPFTPYKQCISNNRNEIKNLNKPYGLLQPKNSSKLNLAWKQYYYLCKHFCDKQNKDWVDLGTGKLKEDPDFARYCTTTPLVVSNSTEHGFCGYLKIVCIECRRLMECKTPSTDVSTMRLTHAPSTCTKKKLTIAEFCVADYPFWIGPGMVLTELQLNTIIQNKIKVIWRKVKKSKASKRKNHNSSDESKETSSEPITKRRKLNAPEPEGSTTPIYNDEEENNNNMGSISFHNLLVVDIISNGGLSNVYKLYDSFQQRWMIAKVAKQPVLNNNTSNFKNPMYYELEILKGMQTNPNVVNIIEHHEINGKIHILMDYMHMNLKGYLTDTSVQPMTKSNQIYLFYKTLESIANPLLELHKMGYAFMDLKPENITLHWDVYGVQIKLIDFGSSIKLNSSVYPELVSSGYFCEVERQQRKIVPKDYSRTVVDVFGLGVTLFCIIDATIIGKFDEINKVPSLYQSAMLTSLQTELFVTAAVRAKDEKHMKIIKDCINVCYMDRIQLANLIHLNHSYEQVNIPKPSINQPPIDSKWKSYSTVFGISM